MHCVSAATLRRFCWIIALLGCSSSPTTPIAIDASAVDSGHDGQGDTTVDSAVDSGPLPIAQWQTPTDPAEWVRPLIGSRGSGNVFVGATLPHGAIKLGPDTHNGAGSLDGYDYDAKLIEGFSHTHLDGPGGSAYGYSQVLLLPQTGTREFHDDLIGATWDHDHESSSPSLYSVDLSDRHVQVELTATAHCGRHRYTFEQLEPGQHPRIYVDLGHTRGQSLGGQVQVQQQGIHGRGDYTVHPMLSNLLANTEPPTGLSSVHAAVQWSRSAQAIGTVGGGKIIDIAEDITQGTSLDGKGSDLGAWAEFLPDVATTTTVEACVCLSWIDDAHASQWLTSPECTDDFATATAKARAAWNARLGQVALTTTSESQKHVFYTGLYHSLLQPADYSEGDSYWNGMANPPVALPLSANLPGLRRFFTDDWCAWDTARTTHPLLTLIAPDVVEDMAQSMVSLGQANGWLPKCTWQASGDSRVMTANFPYAILADAVVKGLDHFDTTTALNLMVKGATQDTFPLGDQGICGYFDQGTPPGYSQSGYVSQQCDGGQSASMTLEYAYHDWCLAQMATHLGKDAIAQKFLARSANWKNVWNPAHAFPQGRNQDGTWVEPFDPTSPLSFTEANAWIYEWFVPHDVCGLQAALGGSAAMVQRLDAFLAGHYDMGNEPDFHAIWLYQDAGRPDRTSDWLQTLLTSSFTEAPDGLPGNDDAGAMSSWYVLNALGLYPVAPGDGWWRLAPPQGDGWQMRVGESAIDVRVSRTSPTDHYVQSVTWQGKPLKEPRILHKDLVAGGVLQWQLGPQPGTWGTGGLCP